MTTRQHRLKTPVIAGPKDRVQWAMNALVGRVTDSSAADDVVSLGPVVPGRKGLGAHGSIHVRRGWRSGLIVAIAARPSLGNAVQIAVIPTSKLQNWLYVGLFSVCSVLGLSVGCSMGTSAAVGMGLVGALAGAFVAILPAVGVQYFGIGVGSDASVGADRLFADIGRWVEQRNAEPEER